MPAPAHFLTDLVLVLGVAALTTLGFRWLRQPVVLGYILAGMIIGPHVPVPLVADVQLVSTLSELGVILLMFSIGLEFSIGKIARLGASAALTAGLEVGLMVGLGYLVAHLLGWSPHESLFAAACLGISSTMIAARAFDEERLRGGFTEVVFAVLVFEDMIAILLLAVLTAVATGSGLSPAEFAGMAARLGGFLATMLVGGLLVVPRLIRAVVRLERSETLLIASMAVCFGMALAAEAAGFSVALGAFVGGMLVAESGVGHRIEPLVSPLRDVFGSIFFVSVGMTIEPAEVANNWFAVALLTVVVLLGKTVGVTAGAFLAGQGLRRSVRAGMSMAQIGEFSFIIAGVGIGSGATGSFLLPVMVAVSCITALTTPLMIRASDRAAALLDARLPRGLQTFVAFYSSWISELRAAPRRVTLWSRVRGTVLVMALDATLLGGVVIGGALLGDRVVASLVELGVSPRPALLLLIAGEVVIGGVFLFGVLRCAQRLARVLAVEVVPAGADGGVDLGTAPRWALMRTLELGITLVVGLPLVVVTQPFVPTGPLVLVAVVLVSAFAVWRSVSNLHGHVRAGSELILEALARQSQEPSKPDDLEHVRQLLPGIPGVVPVQLGADSLAVGRTLGALNLRAITGATVLAIGRAHQGTVLPSAADVLHAGDVLALAGPAEAIEAARALLGGGDATDARRVADAPGPRPEG